MNEFEKLLQSKIGISRAVQELLGHYIMLERYFLSESVSKAVAMDTTVEGSLTSSVVDDVFFLVKKSIRLFPPYLIFRLHCNFIELYFILDEASPAVAWIAYVLLSITLAPS